MRRGTSLRSKLVRVALAYAIALQALLGAFAGLALADAQDPRLSLCRTIASDEAPQSGDHSVPGSHCAVMCSSGACAAGEPPATAGVALEFVPAQAASVFALAVDDRGSPPALRSGLNARGPPSIG
jgi:hypothetical protein